MISNGYSINIAKKEIEKAIIGELYKKEVIDFTYYLKSIMTEDWQSAYLASGSSLLNDDMIRNSIIKKIEEDILKEEKEKKIENLKQVVVDVAV